MCHRRGDGHGATTTTSRAERRPQARLPVDPVRRRRRRVGSRRAPHDVPALRHELPPRERGGRGSDRCRCNRLARARRTGLWPLSAPLPLRQLRRGSRARLLRGHRRRRHVRPRRALRGHAGPPVGAGAGGVPAARGCRDVPLCRPAGRGSPPAPARRPVRADRRLRRRRCRQPDHTDAAAQPEQPVPAGRPGRRRSPSCPHAAQRAARAGHGRRRPRRGQPLRRPLGARRDPLDHRRAAAGVRRAAARGRPAGAGAAAGRRAARARGTVGHPPDHGRRPPRPAPGRGRHRGHRRLRHRSAGARHRRGRLDRRRAVPPVALVQPERAA